MNIEYYAKGDVLHKAGESARSLMLISDGTAVLSGTAVSQKVSKGFILGCIGTDSVEYPYSVLAKDDVTVHVYEYYSYADLKEVVRQNKNVSYLLTYYAVQNMCLLLNSHGTLLSRCSYLFKYAQEQYKNYVSLCKKYNEKPLVLAGITQLGDFAKQVHLNDWLVDYYSGLGSIDTTMWNGLISDNAEYASGLIYNIHEDMHQVLDKINALNRYYGMILDLYMTDYNIDLYTFEVELYAKLTSNGTLAEDIKVSIEELKDFIESKTNVSKDLIAERLAEYHSLLRGPGDEDLDSSVSAKNTDAAANSAAEESDIFPKELDASLDTILKYAGFDKSDHDIFEGILKDYASIPDNAPNDDRIRNIRLEMTKCFYKLYEIVFFKSIHDNNSPAPVKMFMYFGYLDENLAGKDNAMTLYRISKTLSLDSSDRVFTFYDWLKMIYQGKRDPSVNEFNMDYSATLHKLKVEGSISAAEEANSFRDGVKRVQYEIHNMFRSTNKTMSSHVTTFCPVFSEKEVLMPLDKAHLKYKDIIDVLDVIRKMDYSLFFRETVFSAPEEGITKELIQKEVLPDIILMPTVGSRGTMWQEITGRVRTSPGRFILPIFLMDNLPKILIHMCGEFRWELCRRIQGSRWNDISERSITSDYCNYIETYKKSKDFSPEQKEKIKSAYTKCRNSSKEMFSRDYVDYIFYEGNGALRLNKATREILFTYCPFSSDIRSGLEQNAIYRDLLERFKTKRKHALRLLDLSMQRIEKSGHAIPAEIKETRRFHTL